jgi:hypothetical protein
MAIEPRPVITTPEPQMVSGQFQIGTRIRSRMTTTFQFGSRLKWRCDGMSITRTFAPIHRFSSMT